MILFSWHLITVNVDCIRVTGLIYQSAVKVRWGKIYKIKWNLTAANVSGIFQVSLDFRIKSNKEN